MITIDSLRAKRDTASDKALKALDKDNPEDHEKYKREAREYAEVIELLLNIREKD